MAGKKAKANKNNKHEGDAGREFKEHGRGEDGQAGHDLLNSDGFTSGVGSTVDSPAEAKEIDRTREEAEPSISRDQDL